MQSSFRLLSWLLLSLLLPGTSQSVFDVTKYGAVGDGVTRDTAAIRRACEALEQGGRGGVLLFPGNRHYLTGGFNLTSHTMLKLEANAVIRGTSNTSGNDYPLLSIKEIWRWYGVEMGVPGCSQPATHMYSPLVFAFNQRNISIVAKLGSKLVGQANTHVLTNPKIAARARGPDLVNPHVGPLLFVLFL